MSTPKFKIGDFVYDTHLVQSDYIGIVIGLEQPNLTMYYTVFWLRHGYTSYCETFLSIKKYEGKK